MSRLDEAQAILSKCVARYSCEQMQAVALALKARDERCAALLERAALLHEDLDVSDGRQPMAVAIEYRDKIRALASRAGEQAQPSAGGGEGA